jgi:hypothetical protein
MLWAERAHNAGLATGIMRDPGGVLFDEVPWPASRFARLPLGLLRRKREKRFQPMDFFRMAPFAIGSRIVIIRMHGKQRRASAKRLRLARSPISWAPGGKVETEKPILLEGRESIEELGYLQGTHRAHQEAVSSSLNHESQPTKPRLAPEIALAGF